MILVIITKYEQLALLKDNEKKIIIETIQNNTKQLAFLLFSCNIPSFDINFDFQNECMVKIDADMLQKVNNNKFTKNC